MKPIVALASFALAFNSVAAPTHDPIADDVSRLLSEINGHHGKAFSDLKELTTIGQRLSGSENAERAVQWGKAKLESYGVDKVWLQPMKAPHWLRGAPEHAAALTAHGKVDLKITALGTSPGGTVSAPVVEVHSLDEVKKLGDAVKGKIVFYNRPMDASLADTFQAYDEAADQRFGGPSVAAENGAVGALVRSMTTLKDDDHPHTGMTHFSGKAIPAAALSTHAANQLSAALKKTPDLKVEMELHSQLLEPVESHNVIGEIRGTTHPEEIVVVGGHLDSWDLATGAHDDGPGVVQSIEVVRAMKALGIKPARTVRAVLFMSEETGGDGGKEYAAQAKAHDEHHIAALESDRGGFAPVGFTVDGDQATLDEVRSWIPYLKLAGAGDVQASYSGSDVEPLDSQGVPTFGYVPVSTHYFDVHHSALDVLSAVKPSELKAGAAAMAVFTYLAAEKGTAPVKGGRLLEKRHK